MNDCKFSATCYMYFSETENQFLNMSRALISSRDYLINILGLTFYVIILFNVKRG